MASWAIPTPGDFRLVTVVYSHGWFECPPFYWDEESGVLTRVVRDARGSPRILRMSQPAPGQLSITTRGRLPGTERRKYWEALVTHLLGLARDLRGFHSLCRRHRHLKSLPKLGAGRFLRCPSLWEEVVRSICATNITWRQAVSIIGRVSSLGVHTDGKPAWPEPGDILRAGERRLRERCRLGYRSQFVLELARRLVEKDLDLGPAERGELDEEELRALFLSIRGIGPATSDYLMIVGGHGSALSVDSAVYAFTKEKYFGGRRPTEAEIRTLYEPYGEWRGLAFWFEFLLDAWWPSLGWLPPRA